MGPSKSLQVYPGDKIDLDVWAYYAAVSGYGTSTAAMVTSIATAFGGSAAGSGESLKIYNGVNSAVGGFGLGANPGDSKPAAFLNFILFDANYNVMDMDWRGITASANTKEHLVMPTITVKQAGYLFAYLSYEDQSNNVAYFDDFTMKHTKTNVIQSNEYYSHGMPTANSWTRENVIANNFLGNGGTELNSTSLLYDLDYRNFDPALARLNQVDPLADKFSSLSPYHFAYNNPTGFTDPSGAKPWSQDFAESYVGDDYGARNAFAKMVAHNQLAGWVGGAGEGWTGVIDIYGDGYYSPMTGGEAIGLQTAQIAADKHDSEGIHEYASSHGSESVRQWWLVYSSAGSGTAIYLDKSFHKDYDDQTIWYAAYYHANGAAQFQGGEDIVSDYKNLMGFIIDEFNSQLDTNRPLTISIDYAETETGGSTKGRTRGSYNPINMHINHSALADSKILYLVLGHEFYHVNDFDNGFFNSLGTKHYGFSDRMNILEYRAWDWTVIASKQFNDPSLTKMMQQELDRARILLPPRYPK